MNRRVITVAFTVGCGMLMIVGSELRSTRAQDQPPYDLGAITTEGLTPDVFDAALPASFEEFVLNTEEIPGLTSTMPPDWATSTTNRVYFDPGNPSGELPLVVTYFRLRSTVSVPEALDLFALDRAAVGELAVAASGNATVPYAEWEDTQLGGTQRHGVSWGALSGSTLFSVSALDPDVLQRFMDRLSQRLSVQFLLATSTAVAVQANATASALEATTEALATSRAAQDAVSTANAATASALKSTTEALVAVQASQAAVSTAIAAADEPTVEESPENASALTTGPLAEAEVLGDLGPGVTGPPSGLTVPPDGGVQVVDAGGLAVVDAGGTVLVSLGAAAHPIWSPLGQILAYMDLNGEFPRVLIWDRIEGLTYEVAAADGPAADYPAGWIDGQIYYLRVYQDGSGRTELHRAELDGTGDVLLWEAAGMELAGERPIATLDGVLIPTADAWLFVDTAGNRSDRGANPYGAVGEGELSPFGSLIAYPAGGELILAPVESPGSPLATVPYDGVSGFSFSPDGAQVVVADGASLTIYSTADGSLVTSATDESGATVTAPSWGEDGIRYLEIGATTRLKLVQPEAFADITPQLSSNAAGPEPTRLSPPSARSLLPDSSEVGAGFERTEDAKRTREALADSFADPTEALANFILWEWRENAYRTFEIPASSDPAASDATVISISIHRFGNKEGASQALDYFADDVIATQGVEEFSVARVGDQTRALQGEASGSNLVVLYVRDGNYLIRIGGYSLEGDPTDDLVALAQKIIA